MSRKDRILLVSVILFAGAVVALDSRLIPPQVWLALAVVLGAVACVLGVDQVGKWMWRRAQQQAAGEMRRELASRNLRKRHVA